MIDSGDTRQSYVIATCTRTFLSLNELLQSKVVIRVSVTFDYLHSMKPFEMDIQDLFHFLPNRSSIKLDMILDVRITAIVHYSLFQCLVC